MIGGGKSLLSLEDIKRIGTIVSEWFGGGARWMYWTLILLVLLLILIEIRRRRVKRKRNLNAWLDEHYKTLPRKAQRHLFELREEYKPKRSPRYGRKWSQISKEIRRQRPNCEVCNTPTRHVHHKRYRKIRKDRQGDLVALCDMCHYFIHPRAIMTREAFNRYRGTKP